MGSDGANLGVSAGRALDTILGGEPSPEPEEQATPEEVRERVMRVPSPLEGDNIYTRFGDEAYSVAAYCIAKAFVLAEEAEPGILERKVIYGPENTDIEDLWGKEAGGGETAAWHWVTDHYPGFDDWIGGATGFMVGYAYNTARFIMSKPPVPNPAILEINV